MGLKDRIDVQSLVALEQELYRRYGMNACAFDAAGNKITPYVCWANDLCPIIKGDAQGRTQICACANQVLANRARERRVAQIAECDAGLAKIAVPVFDDAFLGTVGCCGHLPRGGSVDVYYVSRVTGLDPEHLNGLLKSVRTMDPATSEDIVRFVSDRIRGWFPDATPPQQEGENHE